MANGVARASRRAARNAIYRVLPGIWIDISPADREALAKLLGGHLARRVASDLKDVKGAIGELLDRVQAHPE